MEEASSGAGTHQGGEAEEIIQIRNLETSVLQKTRPEPVNAPPRPEPVNPPPLQPQEHDEQPGAVMVEGMDSQNGTSGGQVPVVVQVSEDPHSAGVVNGTGVVDGTRSAPAVERSSYAGLNYTADIAGADAGGFQVRQTVIGHYLSFSTIFAHSTSYFS
jgi:hypothetical protein